jgi:hypothetical protein
VRIPAMPVSPIWVGGYHPFSALILLFNKMFMYDSMSEPDQYEKKISIGLFV